MGAVTSYSDAHWRMLCTHGSETERRVLFRQVNVDGASHAEIVDGIDWRPLKDGEYLKAAAKPLPQVDNGWVR